MKKLKQTFLILLATVIFISSLPTTTVFAADVDMRYGRKLLGSLTNGTNLQAIYDKLVTDCGAAKESISIEIAEYNTTTDLIKNTVFPLFFYDYPEFFWLQGGWSGTSNGTVLTLKPEYYMTGSTLTDAKAAYNAKVIELTSGLSGTNYDKAKTLHDRLIATTEYKSSDNDQTAYGALVEGAAVCNGYARAYQHLMNSVGIPTWYVRGTSINPATGSSVGHAWNVVKIDGLWYYTDVTWDDHGKNTFYAYFNVTGQQIFKDHTLEAGYPEYLSAITANSTQANYFVKEDRCFESYDREKLITFLNKDNNKTQIYVDDINTFKTSLDSDLLQLGEALGGKGNFQITYTYSQLSNVIVLDVFLVSGDHTHSVKTTIQAKQPTCLSGGTKEYYICDCGQKFWDSDCTQEVPAGEELSLTAVAHTQSDWKNDSTDHWKQCIFCKIETENTRGEHADNNKDNKCDFCKYSITTASEQNTDTDSNLIVNNSSENENNASSDADIPEDNDIIYTDQTTSVYEEIYLYSDTQPDNAALKWIIICGGAALLLTAVVVIVIIIVKKR